MPDYLTLDEIRVRVAERIRADSRSQQEIADAAGEHQPHVSAILNGRPDVMPSWVRNLAREYGLDIDWTARYKANVKNDEGP